MRISDLSSDVCSSDLALQSQPTVAKTAVGRPSRSFGAKVKQPTRAIAKLREKKAPAVADIGIIDMELMTMISERQRFFERICQCLELAKMRYPLFAGHSARSEAHTSELQSLMRISYAVFCLKKKNKKHNK